jgi:two-component system NtrC family sensor kinase
MAGNDESVGAVKISRRSSVRLRVMAGLIAIMFAFAGLTIYSIFLHRLTAAKIGLINTSYLPLTLGTSEIGATQLVFNTWMDRLADDPNQSIGRVWIDAARRFRPSTLRRLTQLIDRSLKRAIPEKEADFLVEMRRRLVEVEARYLENETEFQKLYDLMDTGHADEARVHIEKLKRIERLLDRVLAGIVEEIGRHIQDLANEAQQDGTRATWILALLTVGGVLVAGAVIVSINRVLAPLKSLQQAVGKVAEGQMQTRIDVARQDEIGAVATGFNRMTAALAERDQMLIRSERLATTGKMAAQVTHEIRNPLSSLRLNAELLEEELHDVEKKTEASALLGAMQDEIERLTGITESYLRFARLPSPTPSFDNLNTLVESALEFMKSEIEERHILIDTDLNVALEPVLFDRSQIRQALTNLLRNACESMPDGGSLQVATLVNDDMVELRVSDTGGGVPAEAQDHIFESFYSTKKSGTGLGLPLVRQICQAHGGNASCLRTGKDGSTFVIALPGPQSEAKQKG